MAISSPIDVKKINKTAEDSKRSIKQSQGLLANILNFGSKRIKEKKTAYTLTGILRDREEERKRRDEAKSELTAQSIVTKEGGSQQLVSSGSSSGFLERIIGFLGYLSAGWILRNLPTWIAMGKEFMARINLAGKILSDSLGSMIDIFGGIGSLLSAYAQNLASFDFLDTQNRVKTAMIDLNTSFGNFQSSMEQALGLITTPLTEGKYSGENVPSLGSESQDQGAYTEPGTPYTPSSGNMSENQKQALNILSKYESASAGGYNAVNQIGIAGGRGVSGFSGDFRKMPQHNGKSLTDMTIAEIMSLQAPRPGMSNREWISQGRLHAVGRYQFIGNTLPGVVKRAGIPTTAKFTPEVQDLLALQYLKEAGIGAWIGPSDRATRQERAIIEQARREPINFRPSISSGPQQTSGQLTTQGQSTRATPLSAKVPPLFKGQGIGAGRNHMGRDIATEAGTALIAFTDGTIVQTGFDSGGYGYYVIWKDSSGVEHLYGHMLENPSFNRGQIVKRGTILGRVGSTGRSSGPHLHWEISPRINEVGYKRSNAIDPLSYGFSMNLPFAPKVSRGEIGKNILGETTSSGQIVPQAQISPSSTQQRAGVAPGITPDRRPQDIMVYQPANQQNIITSSGGSAAPLSTPINDFDLLNNFIKNKLLLDLAYL